MFFRKKHIVESDSEKDFKVILDIVKDYDRAGFNRLLGAIEQAWKAYDIILRTKTRDEKENGDIIGAEKTLDFIEEKNES